MPAQECGLSLSFIGCSGKTKMVFNLKLCPIEVNFQKIKGLKKRKTGYLQIICVSPIQTILVQY